MADDPLDDPIAELVDLAARLGARCDALGLRVATVESCTGGLVGHLITDVAGSSACYLGGFVTYSDELKREVVGVPHDVLAAHGAVSAQVAMAMATGGRLRTGADLAVAVTGIAGPDGGTPEKPVGTVFIGLASAEKVEVWKEFFPLDRWTFKWRVAQSALNRLRLALLLQKSSD